MSTAPRAWVRWAAIALVMALASLGVARARSGTAAGPPDGSVNSAVLWGNAPLRSAGQMR